MAKKIAKPDPAQFIREHMPLAAVPMLPEIKLHTAHPGSGLWRLTGRDANGDTPPPYWAYRWAGGTVLARYILDHPEAVTGKRVLDLGAGSGVVAIAAAKAGAKHIAAADIDPNAIVASTLNARANGVALTAIAGDLTEGEPPDVDLIAIGDLFYAPELATQVTDFLDRCVATGIAILIGDPGRAHLPRARLRLLAEYAVPDFGDARTDAGKPAVVYSFERSRS